MTSAKRAATIAIALIALTVVGAAILGSFVLGLGGSQQKAPQAAFDSSQSAGSSTGAQRSGGPPGAGATGYAVQNVENSGDRRAIVKNGTITVQVDDYNAARGALRTRTDELGGFIAGSGRTLNTESNHTWVTGYIIIRVPAGKFESALRSVEDQGTVTGESTASADVTNRLINLNARIKNLKTKRERLYVFYNRSDNRKELLDMQDRITKVQGKIERLEAKRRALRSRVAFSTLRVKIQEPIPEQARQDEPKPHRDPAFHETPILGALAASVHGVVVLLRTVTVTAMYLLPYLVVFGVAGYVLQVARRSGRLPSIPIRRSDGTEDLRQRTEPPGDSLDDSESSDR